MRSFAFVFRQLPRAAFIACLFLLGCGDDDAPLPTPDAGRIDGGGSFDGSGSFDLGPGDAGEPPGPSLAPLAETPRLAVVLSDFTSTSIGMLRADGSAIDARWMTSGTTLPGLVAALSGDVVLASRPLATDGYLTILDRFRTDVATRVRVPDGRVRGQVRTHEAAGAGGTGFSSNPHDFVYIGPDEAWVSRSEPNLDPTAPAAERGTDLYRIDPTSMRRVGERIDLTSGDVMVDVVDATSGVTRSEVAHGRPSAIVRLGNILLVGLGRFTLTFGGTGSGAVAAVDILSREVTILPIPGLKGCASVSAVPADSEHAVVACAPFGDPAASGFAVLHVGTSGVEVERVFRFADFPSTPLAANNVVALSSRLVVASVYGTFDPPSGDQLYTLDLTTGSSTMIATSTGGFALGQGAYDPTTRRLFVPDAEEDAPRLRRFDRSAAGSFLEGTATTLAPELGLPPRRVYLLEE